MSIKITWGEYTDEDKIVLHWLITAIAEYSISKKDIIINKKGLKRLEKKINRLLEKFIKIDVKICIPLRKKNKDDPEWCVACKDRKVDLKVIK